MHDLITFALAGLSGFSLFPIASSQRRLEVDLFLDFYNGTCSQKSLTPMLILADWEI
jgi:hypothetical protein